MQKLIYRIDGLEGDNGNVRLKVFADKMNSLRLLVRAAAIEARGEDTRKLLISDLSHRSPATVTISGPPDIFDPIADCLHVTFQEIDDDNFKPFLKFALIEAASELVKGLGSAYSRARLELNWGSSTGVVNIDKRLVEKIERLRLPLVVSEGSAKGRIEIVNIHGDQNKFYVYRPAGQPRRVECTFSEELLPKAKEALGRIVTVRGEAKFEKDSLLPTEIHATEILPHDDDDDLPTMSSLIGMAPDATGDINTLEFIEEMRRAGRR